MDITTIIKQLALSLFIILSLSACDSGGGSRYIGGDDDADEDCGGTICGTGNQDDDSIGGTIIGTGKAELGPVIDAEVNVYAIDNRQTPLCTTYTLNTDDLKLAGTFQLPESCVERGQLYLVTVSGGLDIDANDDEIIDDEPTPVSGTFHAFVDGEQMILDVPPGESAEEIRDQSRTWQVTAVSEALFQSVQNLLDLGASEEEIRDFLNQLVPFILDTDLNGDGVINADDVMQFNPAIHLEQAVVDVSQPHLRKIIDDIHLAKNNTLKDVPLNDNLIGRFDTLAPANRVQVQGQTAYIATKTALLIVDVSAKDNPQLLGAYPSGQIYDIAVLGKLAFIAQGEFGAQVIDISDPRHPVKLSSTGKFVYRLDVDQDRVYYCAQFIDAATLYIGEFTLSDPLKPKPQDMLFVNNGAAALSACKVRDGIALMSASKLYQNTVYIAQIEETSAHLISQIDIDSPNSAVLDLATIDNTLYLALGHIDFFALQFSQSLMRYDITNIETPTFIDSPSEVTPLALEQIDQRLLVWEETQLASLDPLNLASGYRADIIDLVDVSRNTAELLLSVYGRVVSNGMILELLDNTYSFARRIFVDEGNTYLAGSRHGLLIYDFPGTPDSQPKPQTINKGKVRHTSLESAALKAFETDNLNIEQCTGSVKQGRLSIPSDCISEDALYWLEVSNAEHKLCTLISGSHIMNLGDWSINPLTDGFCQALHNKLALPQPDNVIDPDAIIADLDRIATYLLKEDINGDGRIDRLDAYQWQGESSQGLTAIPYSDYALVRTEQPSELDEVLVGYFDTLYPARKVLYQDNKAYIATDFALLIVDVLDPTKPTLVGSHPTGWIRDITLLNNELFIALGDAGIERVDISDSRSPRLLERFDTSAAAIEASEQRVHFYADTLDGITAGAINLDLQDKAITTRILPLSYTEETPKLLRVINNRIYISTTTITESYIYTLDGETMELISSHNLQRDYQQTAINDIDDLFLGDETHADKLYISHRSTFSGIMLTPIDANSRERADEDLHYLIYLLIKKGDYYISRVNGVVHIYESLEQLFDPKNYNFFGNITHATAMQRVVMPDNVKPIYLEFAFAALEDSPESGIQEYTASGDYIKRFQLNENATCSYHASDRYGFAVVKH